MNQETDSSSITDLERQLVKACDDPGQFGALLGQVLLHKLTEVQAYLWDYLFTLARENGRTLDRDEVTRRMIGNLAYQRLVGCNEEEETCRAKICFITNPNCSGNKIKMHINTLREMILEYNKPVEEL
ncbi:MAG: hypothetical protein ISR91_04505 [Candidatus Delongbacteria bacterium]|nr:hypothetical protein [Candidatus Delongbacteria bacterium]